MKDLAIKQLGFLGDKAQFAERMIGLYGEGPHLRGARDNFHRFDCRHELSILPARVNYQAPFCTKPEPLGTANLRVNANGMKTKAWRRGLDRKIPGEEIETGGSRDSGGSNERRGCVRKHSNRRERKAESRGGKVANQDVNHRMEADGPRFSGGTGHWEEN